MCACVCVRVCVGAWVCWLCGGKQRAVATAAASFQHSPGTKQQRQRPFPTLPSNAEQEGEKRRASERERPRFEAKRPREKARARVEGKRTNTSLPLLSDPLPGFAPLRFRWPATTQAVAKPSPQENPSPLCSPTSPTFTMNPE